MACAYCGIKNIYILEYTFVAYREHHTTFPAIDEAELRESFPDRAEQTRAKAAQNNLEHSICCRKIQLGDDTLIIPSRFLFVGVLYCRVLVGYWCNDYSYRLSFVWC